MWYRIKSFILFYFRAITKFNVQSSFTFDFVSNVLDTSKNYYFFAPIEHARSLLFKDEREIIITDLGAGSSILNGTFRKISSIAKASLSDSVKCRILFNLVNHYQCKNILELGTSLGISSAYLASANSQSKVETLEGDINIAAVAKEIHSSLNLKNIDIHLGHFEKSLPKVLTSMHKIDLAFIDGHHSKTPTIQYFEQILTNSHNETIIIIDDIYWSKDMKEAWEVIRSHQKVTLSIDLFDIGVIFLKKELSKQSISYISFKYKPWKIGLFN